MAVYDFAQYTEQSANSKLHAWLLQECIDLEIQ